MPHGPRRLPFMFLENNMPRSQTLRCFVMRLFRLASLAVLLFWIPGCHKTVEVDPETLAWDGAPLTAEREILNPSVLQLSEESFPVLEVLPRRFLDVRHGELKLLEFAGETEAYCMFQRIADPSELAIGFASRETSVFFQNGHWLGMWKGQDRTREKLQASLHLPGNQEWGRLPEAFSSILHQGRILRSERVLMGRFLGFTISVPVFAARFDCRGDSAWIYSSPGMPFHFADSVVGGYRTDLSGKRKIVVADSGWMGPVRLEFSESGMVGVEGCFDTSLVAHWLETQETVIKSLKSRH